MTCNTMIYLLRRLVIIFYKVRTLLSNSVVAVAARVIGSIGSERRPIVVGSLPVRVAIAVVDLGIVPHALESYV